MKVQNYSYSMHMRLALLVAFNEGTDSIILRAHEAASELRNAYQQHQTTCRHTQVDSAGAMMQAWTPRAL